MKSWHLQVFQEATEGVAAARTAAAKDTRKKGMRMRRNEEDEVRTDIPFKP